MEIPPGSVEEIRKKLRKLAPKPTKAETSARNIKKEKEDSDAAGLDQSDSDAAGSDQSDSEPENDLSDVEDDYNPDNEEIPRKKLKIIF